MLFGLLNYMIQKGVYNIHYLNIYDIIDNSKEKDDNKIYDIDNNDNEPID